MLYYCTCADFNRHKNNFRALVSSFLLNYAKIILKGKAVSKYELLFLFFEGGGLAQEYCLISDLVSFFKGDFHLTVIMLDQKIDKEQIWDEKERHARSQFIQRLSRHKRITVKFYDSPRDFFKEKNLLAKEYFFVLLASFDPYFFIYDIARDKILSLISYSFLIEAYLYTYNGYRYKQIFEFFIYKESRADEFLHGLYVLNSNRFILRKEKRDISI